MNDPDIFDAIRDDGIDADDPHVRESVRVALEQIDEIRAQAGRQTARTCMRAVSLALSYQLQHPDVQDMSGFEAEFDDEA